MTTIVPRLTFLRAGPLECTPIPSLPDGTLCDVCGESPAVLRVYGSDQPVWTVNQPFTYAECCLECGAVAAAVAELQRSYGGSVVRVEVAAVVWAARDDDPDGC